MTAVNICILVQVEVFRKADKDQ